MSLALIVLLPLAGSLCAAFLPSHARNTAAGLADVVAVMCVILVVLHYPQMAAGGVVRESLQWAPGLGLDIHVSGSMALPGCSRCS